MLFILHLSKINLNLKNEKNTISIVYANEFLFKRTGTGVNFK